MKKIAILSLSALLFLSAPLFGTEIGTYFLGFKYWYTNWDSGALEWFNGQIAEIYRTNWGVPISAKTDDQTGFLSGPVFGYQTRDGKWNMSFAPMVCNHSVQKQVITTMDNSGRTVVSSVDMYRRDFDFAVAYSLSDLADISQYFEYCKLYAGVKHQVVDLEVETAAFIGGVQDVDRDSMMELRYTAQMPTLGFGIAYPITKRVVLGLQGGVGMAFIAQKDSYVSVNGAETDISPDNSIVYNAEVGMNFLPIERLIVQIGYRYQQWEFSLKNHDDFAASDECKDITHGPVAAVVYAF